MVRFGTMKHMMLCFCFPTHGTTEEKKFFTLFFTLCKRNSNKVMTKNDRKSVNQYMYKNLKQWDF